MWSRRGSSRLQSDTTAGAGRREGRGSGAGLTTAASACSGDSVGEAPNLPTGHHRAGLSACRSNSIGGALSPAIGPPWRRTPRPTTATRSTARPTCQPGTLAPDSSQPVAATRSGPLSLPTRAPSPQTVLGLQRELDRRNGSACPPDTIAMTSSRAAVVPARAATALRKRRSPPQNVAARRTLLGRPACAPDRVTCPPLNSITQWDETSSSPGAYRDPRCGQRFSRLAPGVRNFLGATALRVAGAPRRRTRCTARDPRQAFLRVARLRAGLASAGSAAAAWCSSKPAMISLERRPRSATS